MIVTSIFFAHGCDFSSRAVSPRAGAPHSDLLRDHARTAIAPSLTLEAGARCWIGPASRLCADRLLSPVARAELLGHRCLPRFALARSAETAAEVVDASRTPPALRLRWCRHVDGLSLWRAALTACLHRPEHVLTRASSLAGLKWASRTSGQHNHRNPHQSHHGAILPQGHAHVGGL